MRGLHSPIPEKWGAPLWTKRRTLALVGGFTATILLLLHIATITYEYEIPHSPFKTSASSEPKRLLLHELADPSHTILRDFDPVTFHFGDRYRYVKNLGNGFEGAARVYKDTTTGQKVIIKAWVKATRQEPVLPEVADRLLHDHNVTVAEWPVEVRATLHEYNSPYFSASDHSISYAIDAFYTDVPEDGSEFGWRIVMPLYAYGDLEHSIGAVAYLNLTLEDVDWLYRPRFRRVWQMLAKINTAAEPSIGAIGYCHDDVKMDNIFHVDAMGNEILADMGQVRPHNDPFHSDWKDCRLVDAQRAWRTYSAMLRWGQSRNATPEERFEARLFKKEDEWSKAHFKWYETLYTPMDTLANDPFWKNMQSIWKRSSITMPVWKDGQKVFANLSRDQAFIEIDKVRSELQKLEKDLEAKKLAEEKKQKDEEMKKANGEANPKSNIEVPEVVLPWWWWNVPPPPFDAAVDKELAVYYAASELVGAGRSWTLGKTPEEVAALDAEEAKKKEEEERKKEEEDKRKAAAAEALKKMKIEAEKARESLNDALKKASAAVGSADPNLQPSTPSSNDITPLARDEIALATAP